MENLTPDFSEICEQYKSALIIILLNPLHQAPQLKALDTVIGQDVILRNGNQYLRSTSRDGYDFAFPVRQVFPFPIIAWSSILNGKEVLCAVNLDENEAIEYVTIDDHMHSAGSKMRRVFGSNNSPNELNVENRNGKAVRLTIPPVGFVMYE